MGPMSDLFAIVVMGSAGALFVIIILGYLIYTLTLKSPRGNNAKDTS